MNYIGSKYSLIDFLKSSNAKKCDAIRIAMSNNLNLNLYGTFAHALYNNITCTH